MVTAYLDGSLDPETRARFEQHLLGCDGCQTYLEQFRVTIATIGRVTGEQLNPVFRARLLGPSATGVNSLPPLARSADSLAIPTRSSKPAATPAFSPTSVPQIGMAAKSRGFVKRAAR